MKSRSAYVARRRRKRNRFLFSSLTYAGVFTLTNLAEEHLKPALYIECPRYLFPFVRSIVASLTQESSLPPMLINPVDFAALYRARYQGEQQGAGAAS